MKKSKIVVLAILTIALCAALALTAGAADKITKQLDAVYRGIKIYIDGAEFTPKDVNGNVVEPFVVDGTTYVPLRAVSQLFGKDVEWDDENSAVMISSPRTGGDRLAPQDAPPAPSKNVTVSTAQELAEAIAPDTCITLTAGVYDLSTVNKSRTDTPYVLSSAGAFTIYGVEGLTLKAAPGAEVELVTPDRFSEVLLFTACNGVTLSGISAGHSITGDYQCDAGVVKFEYSANITVEDCYFYGSGAIGIVLRDCVTVFVEDTTITDCSLCAVEIGGSADIMFIDCKFVDNRAYGCVIYGLNSEAIFRDCEISGNKQLESSVVLFDDSVLFDGCVFRDNALVSGSTSVFAARGLRLKDCEIEKGSFSGYWGDAGATDLGGNKFS